MNAHRQQVILREKKLKPLKSYAKRIIVKYKRNIVITNETDHCTQNIELMTLLNGMSAN